MSAVSAARSLILSKAAAMVIEPLEGRALLSAGAVLHTELTDLPGNSDTGGAVVRVDGQKLVQVGLSDTSASSPQFVVARFNPDGTPDDTFGGGTSNTVTNSMPDSSYISGAINAAAVDSAGRIVVVGRVDTAAFDSNFFVARFTAEGALDITFSDDGVFFGDFFADRETEARALAIGGGGTIYVAGGARFNDDLFGVAQFNSDGELDGFGIRQTPSLEDPLDGTDSVDTVHAIALDSAGNIVLAGSSLARFAGEDRFVIALQRYLPTGELDDSFDFDGSVRYDVPTPNITAVGDRAFSVAVDQLGRIVVGGTTDGPVANFDSFVLMRFTSTGALDGSFNTDVEPGIVRTYFGGFSSALISDIAIQSDGAIIAAGNVLNYTESGLEDGNTFAVARYDESGQLDSVFGTGGIVLTQSFNGGLPELNLPTLALQSDAAGNQFVALGSWVNGTFIPPPSDDLVLVRIALSSASVELAGPATANEGDIVHFTASFSGGIASGINFLQEQHRAEGMAAAMASTTVSYAWTITLDGASTPIDSGSGTATDTLDIPFIPGDNGLYHVLITINGGEDDANFDISVANVDPVATINDAPDTSDEGATINLGSTVSDAGRDDEFTYAWSVTKGDAPFATGDAATFSFTPDDDGTYVVTLVVHDDDGGVATDSATIDVTNLNPTAAIQGAPASGAEGNAISVSGTASDPGAADTFTFAWAVTKNGSAYTSGNGATFTFTPDDNGTYVLTLTATDDDGDSDTDSATILVTNIAPSVDPISGPASGDAGAAQSFTSAFTDPGSADSWTITWNFGDGSTLTTSGAPGALSATHTYATAGTYTLTLTVTDDDGGANSQSHSITIASTNTTTLTIDGTDGDDDIKINNGEGGSLLVEVNGAQTTHNGITQIVIHAGAGDDKIKVSAEVTQNVVVFGGAGDDSMKGGAGDDILLGGDGDDLLHGNDGRDILIGGAGRDRIIGNADSDILVAGFSHHDANLAALEAILAEWTSGRSYGLRTTNVVGGDVVIDGVLYEFGGERLNGEYFLRPDGLDATVFDDAAIDVLTGSAGQDLFLFNSDCPIRDILTGLANNEFAADIDFLAD